MNWRDPLYLSAVLAGPILAGIVVTLFLATAIACPCWWAWIITALPAAFALFALGWSVWRDL